MKTNKILITVSMILFLTILLCSCVEESKDIPKTTQPPEKSYDLVIKELEEKISELQENHYISEAESKKQIEELTKKLNELKAAASSTGTVTSATLPKSIFTYEIKEEKLYITGFTGDGEHMVIPAEIDGKSVYGISDGAFEGYSFKSVIISEGVEHIDWFAFYNCPALSSVTIPSSVKKIGYSAFDCTSRSFTIYCHENSFAHNYAESYGMTYALI